MKHILIIFILVTEYLFKKRQSFTFLVVTILSPLVFLSMLQVCQEKLQNKFNIVIITNKSHWHLCRKTTLLPVCFYHGGKLISKILMKRFVNFVIL